MVAAVELLKEYRLVHGDPKNLTGKVGLFDSHVHTEGDITSPTPGIIKAAFRRGLDAIAVTNHDTDGYDRASRIRDRLSSRRSGGSPLEIIRGSEITVEGGGHVLAFGFRRRLKSGQPVERLLDEADKQGANISYAHPELAGMSLDEPRISALVAGDNPLVSLEVHNGGAALIQSTKDWPLPHFIRDRIPRAGSNDRAKVIFDQFKDVLYGATGGSDAHNARHVGDVITCYPADMDVFDAIRTGRSFVMERIKQPRVTATNLVVGTVRGKLLERKRQSGKLAMS